MNPVSYPPQSLVHSYLTADEEKAALQREMSLNPHPYHHPSQVLGSQETVVYPSGNNAGQAPAATLSRGLHVPTSNSLVSSGFPFPGVLYNYGVTVADWSRFTSEITEAASMTSGDWAVAVGSGAGAFLVAGLFIGYLGVIPAWFVGRRVHSKRETDNLAKARKDGDLEQKLLKWNQEFFAPKGLLIRLDLPGESYDMAQMDVHSAPRRSGCGGSCSGWSKERTGPVSDKKAARLERKMEKKALKAEKHEMKLRLRAVKKGRIVILPMNRAPAHVVTTSLGTQSQNGSVVGPGGLYGSSVI